ncbi:hypothetical protein FB645_006220 [Coemansia sp. IMI 203386]|nr:hypothetical protein FB645_006220 [Coemansia sp. IMI 203386]
MSAREIISYDDLYSEEEPAQTPATKPRNKPRSTNKRKPKHPVTIEAIDANDDSCTSESDNEAHHGHRDWDDSDLLHAWDSTINEYRREHALLMGDAEYRAEQHKEESRVGKWGQVGRAEGNKRRRNEEMAEQTTFEQENEDAQRVVGDGQQNWETAMWLPGNLEPPQSEEDALHRLSISWYSAGYYAGYYQAFRSASKGNNSSRSDPCATDTQSIEQNAPQQESNDDEKKHE